MSHGLVLIPSLECSTINNVPLTRAHFLDAYSKAKWNLSVVPRPSCFANVGIMCPPDHYNESSRLKAVKRYISSDQWKEAEKFQKLIGKALKRFNVKGASISLVDAKRQVIKYEASLNSSDFPRRVSIDAHTILSNGNFVLLDASKDWRTTKNPLVTDSPNIRFYAGVPLVTNYGSIIGAFAIFDRFPRTEFDETLLDALNGLAAEVISILNAPLVPNTLKLNVSNNISLIKMIGRPTSHRSQLASTALYEKDGSGSQYEQNHNFRYNRQEASMVLQGSLVTDEIFYQISRYRDIKSASTRLCEIIRKEMTFDYVYVIELRTSQKFQILPKYFPQSNVVNADTFDKTKRLFGTDKQQLINRVLGFDSIKEDDIMLDSEFFYGALSSEFGIFYESTPSFNFKLRAGMCMPFYRFGSKIVRKNKILKTDMVASKGKPIDVYVRSGGYLIAVFNEEERPITDTHINYIYGAACSLRRLFIAN
jgi:hypothetical protein